MRDEMVPVGVLLVTYRGSSDKQQIRWVLQSDFRSLEHYLRSQAERAQEAATLRQRIAGLRAAGVSNEQLLAQGIDVAAFELMASVRQPWPVTSWSIRPGILNQPNWLQFQRNHSLDWWLIERVQLVNIQTAARTVP